jgi:hypothetical protein
MLAFLLLLLAPPAQGRWIPYDAFRFQSVDEAERDTSFYQFRLKLLTAVEQRDVTALLARVSDSVAMSVLDKSKVGKAAFIKEWRLDNGRPRDSDLWENLREVLRNGGAFDGHDFDAPYVFGRWPDRFPHLDFYAVTARKAPVYKTASEDSRVLETLRQEIVGRFDELPNPGGWRAVRTASGVTGYMRAEDLRSPLSWRAVFHKEGGEWKLKLFASGDWEAHERLE